MLKPNVISFLSKLKAEKLPPVQSLSIKNFKDKNYTNIHSKEYEQILFYVSWLFICHFRYISNNKTNAKFWVCYECEKPFLWTVIDDNFFKDLLYLILLPIATENIEGFLAYLYTDLCQRLKLNMEFERLSLNWVLYNNCYIDLNTGNRLYCDEVPVVFEIIKDNKFYDSLVVLDHNHLTLSIKDQISYVLSKLRNLS